LATERRKKMGCTQSNDVPVNKNKQAAPNTVDTTKKEVNTNFTNSFSQSADYSGPTPSITTAASSDSIAVNTDYCDKACFGAGCYWGTEKFFQQLGDKKIADGVVGFMGPDGSDSATFPAMENPTYKDVCTGRSGHVEVYNFSYKGGIEVYEELVKIFFQFHDPTTANRQGNDKGPQYASVIYCYSEEQEEAAKRVKALLQANIDTEKLPCPYTNKKIMTDIRRSTAFYAAHDEHQNYLMTNPNGYCNHRLRAVHWPVMP
jgi:peptide-methionine (S)-S-oxide reductase